MKFNSACIDISKVRKVIYHLPNGKRLQIEVGDLHKLAELQYEIGSICDTSDIDGMLHFFPRGNA